MSWTSGRGPGQDGRGLFDFPQFLTPHSVASSAVTALKEWPSLQEAASETNGACVHRSQQKKHAVVATSIEVFNCVASTAAQALPAWLRSVTWKKLSTTDRPLGIANRQLKVGLPNQSPSQHFRWQNMVLIRTWILKQPTWLHDHYTCMCLFHLICLCLVCSNTMSRRNQTLYNIL